MASVISSQRLAMVCRSACTDFLSESECFSIRSAREDILSSRVFATRADESSHIGLNSTMSSSLSNFSARTVSRMLSRKEFTTSPRFREIDCNTCSSLRDIRASSFASKLSTTVSRRRVTSSRAPFRDTASSRLEYRCKILPSIRSRATSRLRLTWLAPLLASRLASSEDCRFETSDSSEACRFDTVASRLDCRSESFSI
mmetsp:Transcript_5374/g.9293  ORF Transcript_5374/g.9293 Transcript_5374/m.9293 type:complete len:200 (-) Transcript_5374:492-1091(-)